MRCRGSAGSLTQRGPLIEKRSTFLHPYHHLALMKPPTQEAISAAFVILMESIEKENGGSKARYCGRLTQAMCRSALTMLNCARKGKTSIPKLLIQTTKSRPKAWLSSRSPRNTMERSLLTNEHETNFFRSNNSRLRFSRRSFSNTNG